MISSEIAELERNCDRVIVCVTEKCRSVLWNL